jgi:hypothetical protein
MKITSLFSATLVACTAYVLPAAEEASSNWQDNPLLAKTVACVIGTDNRAIVGFHKAVPANTIFYPNGPTHGNYFGFAIVATDPSISAAVHESKTIFDQKHKRSHYFKVDDTQSLGFQTSGFTIELPTYTAVQYMARRYLLLCSHTSDNLRVKKIVEQRVQKDTPEVDFAAMLAFVKEQLPSTTFVLFDAATYQEERAMYHIPETMCAMLMQAAIARQKSPTGKPSSKHKKSSSIC